MKTKELIKRLQEADPTGEVECCVGNLDIYYLSHESAYYDGALQVLLHDETKRDKAWSVIGAKLKGNGTKIQIHTMSIEDVIFDVVEKDTDDFPVSVEGYVSGTHYEKDVERWKQEARKIHKEIREKHEQVNTPNQ
jgi:hypothetical protein